MISISRQCELLDIFRSSYYYCPKDESSYNLILMKLIDEQYTLRPFYGVPRMTAWLRREGHLVNPKRVRRLMSLMGFEAIYPKPRLSQSCPEHNILEMVNRNTMVTVNRNTMPMVNRNTIVMVITEFPF